MGVQLLAELNRTRLPFERDSGLAQHIFPSYGLTLTSQMVQKDIAILALDSVIQMTTAVAALAFRASHSHISRT